MFFHPRVLRNRLQPHAEADHKNVGAHVMGAGIPDSFPGPRFEISVAGDQVGVGQIQGPVVLRVAEADGQELTVSRGNLIVKGRQGHGFLVVGVPKPPGPLGGMFVFEADLVPPDAAPVFRREGPGGQYAQKRLVEREGQGFIAVPAGVDGPGLHIELRGKLPADAEHVHLREGEVHVPTRGVRPHEPLGGRCPRKGQLHPAPVVETYPRRLVHPVVEPHVPSEGDVVSLEPEVDIRRRM
ncbi:hypothetical protein SDC9_64603 [bioreactor metagenome]|uniref:Uncharacterized protein n=1 Tax=bioreactor metagenome TaxID=1076179 RepID=A0A644XQF0_9ZZZZ